jgi:hypothetical protein
MEYREAGLFYLSRLSIKLGCTPSMIPEIAVAEHHHFLLCVFVLHTAVRQIIVDFSQVTYS